MLHLITQKRKVSITKEAVVNFIVLVQHSYIVILILNEHLRAAVKNQTHISTSSSEC